MTVLSQIDNSDSATPQENTSECPLAWSVQCRWYCEVTIQLEWTCLVPSPLHVVGMSSNQRLHGTINWGFHFHWHGTYTCQREVCLSESILHWKTWWRLADWVVLLFPKTVIVSSEKLSWVYCMRDSSIPLELQTTRIYTTSESEPNIGTSWRCSCRNLT